MRNFSSQLILSVSTFCLLNSNIAAQQKACGTMHADSMIRAKNPAMGTLDDFENWMQQKIAEGAQGSAKAQTIYTFPVIVHVIHSGQAVGVTRNISDAQINSQITVLNNDFRKLNADISNVPATWTSVAADCEINFCMAQKSPTGALLSSPGIERIDITQMGYPAPPYTIAAFENIKSSTIWDPNKYLNIWVTDFNDPSVSGTLLGYATFPPGSTLSGITTSIGTSTTDGVAIKYTAFGTTGVVVSPNNKGRTTVHEVGHWLGLRHTWGDDNNTCSADDFCTDTPVERGPIYGTPTFPKLDNCSSTSPGVMFMNFMDYTNDASSIMFTGDQKTRIKTVMANSSMRISAAGQINCLGVGIETEKIMEDISVYPNPAKDKLHINLPGDSKVNSSVDIKIYGMLGNLVAKNELKNIGSDLNIDISTYSEGVYFVEVRFDENTYLKKIVVSR